MKRRLFGACGVLAVVALSVGGCKSDPLSDLDGNPASVVTDFSYLQMPIGATAAVTASVLDARTTPLEIPVTFTACTNDVTVTVDTSYHPVPATSSRAIVTAVTANPSCVRAAGGGLEDTIVVAVLPQAFAGAVSSATPQAGDTLTISSTQLLKFDVATVTVTFAGGRQGTIVSKTADQVKVLVPVSSAGPLSIGGISVTYAPGVIVTLPTTATVTQTGNRWAAANSWQTAPNITALIPADSGATTRMIVPTGGGNSAVCPEVVLGNATPATNDNSTGPCMLFRFDLTDTTTVRFRADWDGTAAIDIDIYVCADTVVSAASFGANCFEDGGGGATGAKPQTTSSAQFTAGSHWLVIELFGGSTPANNYITILRQP